MSRAEMRRQKRQQEKINSALKKAGVPEFQIPVAPMRLTGLTDQELANMTGAKVVELETWRKEQTELIEKAAIKQAQETLDRAEEYITFHNILTSFLALDGFRYGKAAANYLLENYNECTKKVKQEGARKTYENLNKKFGIEFEFDEPDLNKELGFEDVDWMNDYIHMNIPYSVYCRIQDDARNIQNVYTLLAVIWELCEGFGFHKHPDSAGNKLDKFMRETKEKCERIDRMEHGARDTARMLKEKYKIDIGWEPGIQETIERFDL